MTRRVLVVGAGFAGSTMARQLADAGVPVTVIDKRAHLGGNAFDTYDSNGLLIHPYGPHIFHTNAARVFDWLSRFTEWRPYEHRVLAKVGEGLVPVPINRTTINALYNLNLDEKGIEQFLDGVKIPVDEIKNSEDLVLSSVGLDLCEKIFRGYTRKQWGLDLSELSAGVAARIPTRINDDDRYFTDSFQAMPKSGYTALFEKMLRHGLIDVRLSTPYRAYIAENPARYCHVVFTGPIDEYFEYRFGHLPYRSLEFEHLHFAEMARFQAVGTVNYPNDYEFTRVTEFKHLTGQVHAGTSIVREYSRSFGEPFYPIPRPESEAIYQRYKKLAAVTSGVTFLGRLAQYRYYNMDQVVAGALKKAEQIIDSIGSANGSVN